MIDSGQMNAADGHEHMPYAVLVIHTVISTCQPAYNVLTARLKSTIPVRLAFKVPSLFESCIILDRLGTESLTGGGEALFQNDLEPIRIQCATVSEHELERICQHIKRQPHPAKPFILPEAETDKTQDDSKWDNLFDDTIQGILSHE